MHADTAPTETVFDASGTIISDIVCRRCGYNLRGLHRDGRCPECGAAVGLSTQGDLLRFADPDWVDQLARGAKYVYVGIIVAILGGIIVGCAGGMIFGMTRNPNILMVNLVGYAFKIGIGAIILYGAWIATAPDPSGLEPERFWQARRIARLGFVCGFACTLLTPVAEAVATAVGSLQILFVVTSAAMQLFGTIGMFAGLTYLAKLADRIPEQRFARYIRRLRTAFAIVLILGMVFMAAATIGLIATTGAKATYSAGNQGFVYNYKTSSGPNVPPNPNPAPGANTAPAPNSPSGSQSSVTVTQWPASVPSSAPTSGPAGTTFPLQGMVLGALGMCLFVVLALLFAILSIIALGGMSHRLARQAEYARQAWAASEPGAVTPPPLPPAPLT